MKPATNDKFKNAYLKAYLGWQQMQCGLFRDVCIVGRLAAPNEKNVP